MKNAGQLIERIVRNPDLCDDGVIVNALLREFHRGYPIENLRLLLSDQDAKAVKAGIFITSELGIKARLLLNEVSGLLRHPDLVVRFYAIDSMLTCTSGGDERAIGMVILMLDDVAGAVRRKTLDFLSRASEEQLGGALRYFEKTQPDSVHVVGLSWLSSKAQYDVDSVLSLLQDDNPVLRKYAVAAAARIATRYSEPLELASSLKDEDVRLFANDVLELRGLK
jgi:hypothetical protein